MIKKRIIYKDEIPSTNTFLKEKKDEFDEGTVIVAKTQTAGRGRVGHTFDSPKGGLYFSILLKPHIELEILPLVTVIAGNSIHKTLKKISVDSKIKWPNDIYFKNKKLCGILTERIKEDVIVGVGLNVLTKKENLPSIATSVFEITKKEYDKKEILDSFLFEFFKEYGNIRENKREIIAYLKENLYRESKEMEEWIKILRIYE